MKSGSWSSIFVIYLFGVCASAAVARIIPLATDIMSRFGIDDRQFGWLIALIAVPAVLLAIPSSLVVGRFGARTVLIVAAAIGAFANMIDLVADRLWMLQAARLIEGVAVVHIYTAAPTLLMATVDGPRRTQALTLWATYAPIGTAVGLGLGSIGAGSPDWRLPFALFGALMIGVGLLACLLPRQLDAPKLPTLGRQIADLGSACVSPPLVALGLAAFMVISMGFGVNITFPDWFVRVHHISPAAAAGAFSLLTLLMLPGSFGAGALMSKAGMSPLRLFLIVALFSFATGIFSFQPELGLAPRYVVAGTWILCSGAALAIVMAVLPLAAGPARHGAAAALVNQAGALATFVNPPLWRSMLAGGAWGPFVLTMATGWMVSVAAMLFVTSDGNRNTEER